MCILCTGFTCLENISDKDELCELHVKYREVLLVYHQVKSKLTEVVHKVSVMECTFPMKNNEIQQKEKDILTYNRDLWSLRMKFKECETKYKEELTVAKSRIGKGISSRKGTK